jgi:transposase
MRNNHSFSVSREAKEGRRLKAGEMFKGGMSQAEVARKLRVSPASVHGWYHAWKEEGMRGLKSKGHPGFVSEFTEADGKRIREAILKGARKYGYNTDLWTVERIGAVMKRVTGKSFGTTWTWHIVTQLGFTNQKPERRSKERDEEAIQTWKRNTFPWLKKMGAKA